MNEKKEYLYEYKSDSIGLAEIIKDVREDQKQKDILEFLKRIRYIPLFWALDDCIKEVYEEIDNIRDFYQKELKKGSE